MSTLPDELRAELDAWGFRSERKGEGDIRLNDDASELIFTDDAGADYKLAGSLYDANEMEGTGRAFLATVLDVFRWAMEQPVSEPHVSKEADR